MVPVRKQGLRRLWSLPLLFLPAWAWPQPREDAAAAFAASVAEAFAKSRRVGREKPDFAFARSAPAPGPFPEGLPHPGRNMPHLDLRTLLDAGWAFGMGYDLRDFLDRTFRNLWLASRRFGDRLDWDAVVFSFGEVVGGQAQAHGGPKRQTLLWQTPHGEVAPEPPDAYTFIHELAHAYQYQQGFHTPLGILVQEQVPALFGREAHDYEGRKGLAAWISDPARTRFAQLDAEPAAEILTHYAALKDNSRSRAARFLLAERMDPSVKTFADAEELFKLLEHYAAQVLPEPGVPGAGVPPPKEIGRGLPEAAPQGR